MELFHTFPDGIKLIVSVDKEGVVHVTGASFVKVHIPFASRPSGLKTFPHSPEGEISIDIITKGGTVSISTCDVRVHEVHLEEINSTKDKDMVY